MGRRCLAFRLRPRREDTRDGTSIPAMHTIVPASLLLFVFAVADGRAQVAAEQQPQDAAASSTVHLRGRVLAWDGKPIAGASVALAPFESITSAKLLAEPASRTGADGAFDLAAPAQLPTNEPLLLLIAQKGMASIARYPRWTYEKGSTARFVPVGSPAKRPRLTDTDLGEIVLPDGARLFGRVRDTEGKALAGAVIVARDLLDHHRALQGQNFDCACRATTDDSGIFQLATTLPNAVTIEVSQPGYFRQQLDCVSIGTPLEFTLQKSGTISGRVLDAEGRGVADASVSANYERRGTTDRTRTGADGSFRLSLDYAARYRITATKTTDNKSVNGTSDVLEGQRGNLEIALKAKNGDGNDADPELKVRAVAKNTGQPIAEFHAASVFQEYANRNANYLEYLFSRAVNGWVDGKAGEATVPGPGKGSPNTGVVRVAAKGFAPLTKRDVEYHDPEPGKPAEPVLMELIAESSLQGKVVDETSGAPIADALVWASPKQEPNQGVYDPYNGEPPPDAVRTAADGTFALRELCEGSWQIRCQHPQRPRVPPETVELAAEQQKQDFVLKLPAGAVVEGHVTGMAIPQGTRALLQELPRSQFLNGNVYYNYRSVNGNVMDSAVPVGVDGAFQFRGVKLDSFMFTLVLPSPPRCGGNMLLPLEPFRVRKDGVRRDIAADAEQPGTIGGTVAFKNAAAPFDRLVVVAQQVAEDQQQIYYSNQQYNGPRSFVGADARFSVRVGPGTYKLILIDLATGVALATTKTDVKVRAGGQETTALEAELESVHVTLAPEDKGKPTALVDRIEVRHEAKNATQKMNGNDNYEQAMSVGLAAGQTELTMLLPAGNAVLLARNNVTSIRTDDQRWNVPPLGRQELEIKVAGDARMDVEMKIGAPPEIVDPNAKPADVADDAGNAKAATDKKGGDKKADDKKPAEKKADEKKANAKADAKGAPKAADPPKSNKQP
jgi:protocatechuate 3,4-dioxygenase beta subunit